MHVDPEVGMVEEKLQIGIAMAQNSEAYLEFMLWTIARTATMPMKFILGVNEGADRSNVERIVAGHDADIFDAVVTGGYGSMNHGACLDLIFARMSPGLGMMIDCDVAFLQHGWDIAMKDCIMGSTMIVGAEYDGAKYLGFPNVICAMFDVAAIRLAGVSFMTEGMLTLHADDCEIYGYGAAQCPRRIILDTGSELPRKLKAVEMNGAPMPMFRAGHPLARFMTDGIRGEEYQLHGTPICTHLGRSFTRRFGVDPDAIAWEKRVREHLA